MAGASLLTLLDDIATVLDDVALMTKVAARKTAGVLGDDLALNAQQVAGVRAERELPVVWAVARGSFRNKLILVPVALLLSVFAPFAVTPLLMLGGAYLCYEGFEKLAHRFLHAASEDETQHREAIRALGDSATDMVAFEKEKIRGAIRTDFILSAEIIVIALGTVQSAPLATRIAVVSGIALLMTVGVYGLVAGIVRMDDAGQHLLRDTAAGIRGSVKRGAGWVLLGLAPKLMRFLAIAGTAAMFLVGGSILVHGFPVLHDWPHIFRDLLATAPLAGGVLAAFAPILLDLLVGIAAGALVLSGVSGVVALGRALRICPH
ncbi:MAG: DUF808 domain-containing protein [Gammaproteobacteria bacterium]|nr:DUF808 domain-containing protein [Gammaproteobacteria bacterium]MBP6053244.1 DUF808 domain-containing protein [Pseudomonadales bacterium]MBK6582294.1 DUF808 domain-containing protein [Gammaproteobacteria bacterium]MBK7521433.1 DUF808 domain-containing protein [Gammaproteobacteria bacterium]MBK7729211.1 DUF808 domain-containing protein [Gammaproteobacteria bacterium]